MNILALNGSNSRQSIHEALLDAVLERKKSDWTIQRLRLCEIELPLFSIDREKAEGIPPAAMEVAAAIEGADALLLASPEHNGSTPAALKNLIDWMSRGTSQKFLTNTKVLLLSTSPGPRGGASNMEHLARLIPHWGGRVAGSFSLGSFNQHFDEEKGLTFPDAEEAKLAELLAAL